MYKKVSEFFISNEKFNLGFIAKNFIQLAAISLMQVFAILTLEKEMNADIRIIAASVQLYLEIFWFLLLMQPVFVFFGDMGEKNISKILGKKLFIIMIFMLYYISTIIGVYYLQQLIYNHQ
jgi:hypothetical protein